MDGFAPSSSSSSSSTGAVSSSSSSSTGVALTGCVAYTTAPTCRAAGCYFDMWLSADGLQACWDNIGAEIDSYGHPYPCSYWAGEANYPSDACAAHGCTYVNNQCINTYSQETPYGQPGAIAVTNLAQWDSVQQTSGTDEFTFRTLLPFDMSITPVTWWAAVVGSDNSDIAHSMVANYSQCTSLLSLSNGLPVYPASVALAGGYTLAQVKYNVRDWIERYGNLAFAYDPNYVAPATPAVYPGYDSLSYVNSVQYVAYMKQLLGNFQTASPGNLDEIIQSVAVNSSTMSWNWKIKVAQAKNCPGVVQTVTSGSTSYTIPTGVLMLTQGGGTVGVFNTFYLTESSSGAISMTPNSVYRSSVFLDNAVVLHATCPTNYARSEISYSVVYYGIYSSTINVGPQSASDIHSSPRSTEEYVAAHPGFVALSDGYFETTQSFTGPVCDYTAGTCTSKFMRVSECRPLNSDGNSFISNADGYYDPTLGYATLSATPVVINGQLQATSKHDAMLAVASKFDFYINVQSCIGGTSCSVINASPTGDYDYAGVTMQLEALPSFVFAASRLEVTAGLIDANQTSGVYKDPGALLPSEWYDYFMPLSKVLAISNGITQPATFPFISTGNRSASIPDNRAITPLIRLSDANLAGTDLRIGIGATDVFRMTPMQTVGNLDDATTYVEFPGTTPADYATLKPFMTYVSKNGMAGCSSCVKLPLLGTSLGIDAFSIPVANLNGGTVAEGISVWPGSNFQAIKIELTYYIGTGGDTAGGGRATSRRLLQSNDFYQIAYNPDGTVSSVFVVDITNPSSVTLVPLSSWCTSADTPSNADEALVTSTLAVVAGNLLVLGLSYKATK